jgi:hypothetical protein
MRDNPCPWRSAQARHNIQGSQAGKYCSWSGGTRSSNWFWLVKGGGLLTCIRGSVFLRVGCVSCSWGLAEVRSWKSSGLVSAWSCAVRNACWASTLLCSLPVTLLSYFPIHLFKGTTFRKYKESKTKIPTTPIHRSNPLTQRSTLFSNTFFNLFP